MLGNVFSPWYARARRRGPADPLCHVTMNVALYAPGRDAWSLTERGPESVRRTADELTIGASTIALAGEREVVVRFRERTAPWGRPLEGQVRLELPGVFGVPQALDEQGAHTWWPVAPSARARVHVESHGLRFEGSGYFDANAGDEPLERRLSRWTWARVDTGRGTVITYDVTERSGRTDTKTLAFDEENRLARPPELLPCDLGRAGWGIGRPTRADHSQAASVVRTLEDAPFYARTQIAARIGGRRGHGVHESLDLERFDSGWVQRLLPFRMRDER